MCISFINSTLRHKSRKFKFQEEFEVWIRLDGAESGDKEYRGRCRRQDVMDSTQARPLGLYIYRLPKNISGDIAKALVQVGEREYYLPYRIVTGEWKATKAGYNRKDFVQTTITIEGQTHSFKLKVDYNSFTTNPVTYEELVTFASELTKRSNAARTEVVKGIDNLKKLAGEFKVQSESAQGATRGLNGLKEKLNKAQADRTVAETERDTNSQEMEGIHNQINQSIKLLSELRLKEEGLTTKVNANNNLLKTLTATINELQTQIASGVASATTFETKATLAKSDWDSIAQKLKSKAPEYNHPAQVDIAKSKFEVKDIDGVKHSLSKVIHRRYRRHR
jgi:hypothetical protein